MKKFNQLTSVVASILDNDLNTDQIIPSIYLKDVNADLGFGLFAYLRRTSEGNSISEFILEKPEFRNSKILLVGDNFGCGSSREHAVWALQAFGFECLIGLSFADLFMENCFKNGLLPISLNASSYGILRKHVLSSDSAVSISVDLERCLISSSSQVEICKFTIPSVQKMMLLEGLDDIGLTLKDDLLIEKWEKTALLNHSIFQTSINDLATSVV
jgi:3-isopropylmalate/(R)-2-methylmalate dehydratase small subunit